jgi:transposase-like protein/ribosomal protein L37AE/L43A
MISVDFPQSLPAFMAAFGTNEQCREYLIKQKWPTGFVCPKCGHGKSWQLHSRDIWVCSKCEHHTSLIANTCCHGSRKPLTQWFLAMYFMSASKRGLSAKELQRHLRCSYQTAWAMLHKLRSCMVDPNRKPLKGEVEIDESYIGGPEEGQRGRGAAGKTIMICAAEKVGRAMGRIRLGIIEQASREKITAFLNGRVELGTTAHTDGWHGYNSLERSGFWHIATSIKASEEKAHIILPRVHLVFSLVKRWILGTHQGSISTKHLRAYLEEFTFRFNRRKAKNITHFFQRLAEGLVREKCQPYWKIVGRVASKQPLGMAA